MNTRFLVVSMWNKPGEGKISPSFQDTIKQTWSHKCSHFKPWCQHGWKGRVHSPVNVSNRLAASALHKQLRPTFSVFDPQNEQTNKRAYSYQLGQCWCLKPPSSMSTPIKAAALINMYTPSKKSHAWIRKPVHQTASRYLKKWATFDGWWPGGMAVANGLMLMGHQHVLQQSYELSKTTTQCHRM
jgi:hypothetical protein